MSSWLPPPSYRMMAVFGGERADLAAFLQVWLQWGGALDLTMGAMDPDALSPNGFPRGFSIAAAVPVERTPSHYLVEWWLEQPHWHLFYQPRQRSAADWPDEAAEPPQGVYLPWGVSKIPRPSGSAAIQWENGALTPLPAAWRNLCEFLDRGPVVFVPPDRARLDLPASPGRGPEATPYTLQVALNPPLHLPPHTNPRAELMRVRTRINQLLEQAASLEWQLGEREVVSYAYLYLELPEERQGAGTHWDVRNWYLTASDQAVSEYVHARVNLGPLGIFHVVRPKDLLRAPASTLPRPAFRLMVDRRWYRFNRLVYVSEHQELRPAPPESNQHVRELLERSLWEGRDCEQILMAVVAKDRNFRFAVPPAEFTPLADSLGKLNLHVALESTVREPEPKVLEEILNRSRTALVSVIDGHATEMKRLLDGIWSGARISLETCRRQVAQGVDMANKIQEVLTRIEALRNKATPALKKNWDTWRAYLDRLLQNDREVLPLERAQVKGWLEELDQARSLLSNGWVDNRDTQVREAAAKLRLLSRRMSGDPGE